MPRFVIDAKIVERVECGYDEEGAIRAHPHNIVTRYFKQI